jgi:hypothetical protein
MMSKTVRAARTHAVVLVLAVRVLRSARPDTHPKDRRCKAPSVAAHQPTLAAAYEVLQMMPWAGLDTLRDFCNQ